MKVSFTMEMSTDVITDVNAAAKTGLDTGLSAGGAAAGTDAAEPPRGLGRNVYRIVQEALTNARKHAGGAPVTVTVSGGPGDGVTVEVRNPRWSRHGPRIPGAGAGLIGLAERVQLAGGRLEHGPVPDGDFRLLAWLPWAS
jgi:signal transduction histidine kinase